MQLTVFNGSPRIKKSNTRVFLDQFIDGFLDNEGKSAETTVQTYYLGNRQSLEQAKTAFLNSEAILLGFPLYTDAMPGIVKEFIESLKPHLPLTHHPRILFFVQSGFPEGVQLRAVEKYLDKLARRLKAIHSGTILKTSGEGVQVKPPRMVKKDFEILFRLGREFSANKRINQELASRLIGKEQYNFVARIVIRLLVSSGLINFYWNSQLKQNNAYQNRFDAPHQ